MHPARAHLPRLLKRYLRVPPLRCLFDKLWNFILEIFYYHLDPVNIYLKIKIHLSNTSILQMIQDFFKLNAGPLWQSDHFVLYELITE